MTTFVGSFAGLEKVELSISRSPIQSEFRRARRRIRPMSARLPSLSPGKSKSRNLSHTHDHFRGGIVISQVKCHRLLLLRLEALEYWFQPIKGKDPCREHNTDEFRAWLWVRGAMLFRLCVSTQHPIVDAEPAD
jgi:hypothetical protein